MNRKLLILAAVAALAVACEKKEEAPSTTQSAEPTTATAAPATTPAAVATAAQIDLETLPTEEEFEDEADKEITPANLEKKLDELEKEISAE